MAQDNRIPVWQVGLAAQQLYAQLSLATGEGNLALLLQQTDRVLNVSEFGLNGDSGESATINYLTFQRNGAPAVSVSVNIGQKLAPLIINYFSYSWGYLVLMTACAERLTAMPDGHADFSGNFIQSKTISPANYQTLRAELLELSALSSQSR